MRSNAKVNQCVRKNRRRIAEQKRTPSRTRLRRRREQNLDNGCRDPLNSGAGDNERIAGADSVKQRPVQGLRRRQVEHGGQRKYPVVLVVHSSSHVWPLSSRRVSIQAVNMTKKPLRYLNVIDDTESAGDFGCAFYFKYRVHRRQFEQPGDRG